MSNFQAYCEFMRKNLDSLDHDERATVVGSSEIAAIAGVCPYNTPLVIWDRKNGGSISEEENSRMFWGKVHEPSMGFFLVNQGFKVEKPVNMIKHQSVSGMGCNADFVVRESPEYSMIGEFLKIKGLPLDEPGIAEAKCRGYFMWKKDGEEPSKADMYQLQDQLECYGYRWGVVMVLVDGIGTSDNGLEDGPKNAPFLFPYMKSELAGKKIISLIDNFWLLIKENRTPPIEGGRDLALMNHMLGISYGDSIDLCDREDLLKLGNEHLKNKELIAEAEDRNEDIKAFFTATMEDSEHAIVPEVSGSDLSPIRVKRTYIKSNKIPSYTRKGYWKTTIKE